MSRSRLSFHLHFLALGFANSASVRISRSFRQFGVEEIDHRADDHKDNQHFLTASHPLLTSPATLMLRGLLSSWSFIVLYHPSLPRVPEIRNEEMKIVRCTEPPLPDQTHFPKLLYSLRPGLNSVPQRLIIHLHSHLSYRPFPLLLAH